MGHEDDNAVGHPANAGDDSKNISNVEDFSNLKGERANISFDLSSEFRGFTPRMQEGLVQSCRIGEAQTVEFVEPKLVEDPQEDEEKGSEKDKIGESVESDDDDSNEEPDDQEW